MRYIFLLLLIIASVAVFIALVIPRYDVIKQQRADIATYDSNLDTLKKLQVSRDALIAQYNDISQTDLDNIQALLPDSVDNIRLIIQIDSLATKNGLSSLRAVDYNADDVSNAATDSSQTADATTDPQQANLPYGEFDMSFQTSGQYSNFLAFLSDLEENLRLVDVTEIDFTPVTAGSSTASVASGIQYKVSIQTYWLKK
jgi:Tfp pilus assembly protein PilO